MFSVIPLHALVRAGHLEWAAGGLLAAGVTDIFDGLFARRWGCVSSFGAKLDSAADNVLGIAAFLWIVMLYPALAEANTALAAYYAALYLGPAIAGYFISGSALGLHVAGARLAAAVAYATFAYTLVSGPNPSIVPFYLLGAAMTVKAADESMAIWNARPIRGRATQ